MKEEIGLWIDHRTVIEVMLSNEGEEVREIRSHMEKPVRYSDETSEAGALEDGCRPSERKVG